MFYKKALTLLVLSHNTAKLKLCPLKKNTMKFLIIISALLVVTLAEVADPHGIADVHKKCQGNPETQVDEAELEKLEKHKKFDIPENLKKHIVCMGKGLNLLNEHGKVNQQGIKTHVQHVITEEHAVEEITNKCAIDEETEEKTAVRVWKCLHKHHVFQDDHSHDHHHHSSENNETESDEHHQHGHHHEHKHH